jgi:hypothetical protein
MLRLYSTKFIINAGTLSQRVMSDICISNVFQMVQNREFSSKSFSCFCELRGTSQHPTSRYAGATVTSGEVLCVLCTSHASRKKEM